MRAKKVLQVVVAAFAVLAAGALRPDAVQAQGARFYVPSDSVAVGDRFHVVFVVDRPESAEAIFPDPARGDSALGDLLIVDLERLPASSPSAAGFARDSVVYEVTTFALDSAVVEPQRVMVVADGDTAVLATQRQVIPVRSLVPEDAQDVRDLAPIVPFRSDLWPWILGGLSAIVAAAIGYLLFRRRRRRPEAASPPPPLLPPYEEALQRLGGLDGFDLERPADVKPYYVEVSDILRTYLERRDGYPALESTTRELVRHLERAQLNGFPSTAVARVRMILDRSDLVKFADRKPAPSEGYETAAETRRVLEEIEQALRAAEERALASGPAAPSG